VKKKLDKTPPISQKMRDSSVRKERGGYYSQSPKLPPTSLPTQSARRCSVLLRTRPPTPFVKIARHILRITQKKTQKKQRPHFHKTIFNQKKV
jgi:hypothetical protein